MVVRLQRGSSSVYILGSAMVSASVLQQLDNRPLVFKKETVAKMWLNMKACLIMLMMVVYFAAASPVPDPEPEPGQ
ncbi:hypothetical protein TNCT_105841 [Trichonephila clavata]|uniref:Uncharacterized protein n=1 Tax=Trichonephila clavata TaxID=2740835 RepID=A0A8X6JCB2_TRICU|nr:hypothetical protein TNCT_105841 [Trichonephila clavata]